MKTALQMNELAEEYLRFQKLNESEENFVEQLQQYEMLNNKIQQAGTSFYDVARYADAMTV